MTRQMSQQEAEEKVGVLRDATVHLARAVSDEQTVYILHSQRCYREASLFSDPPNLTLCEYSLALDRGIDLVDWADFQNRPVRLSIDRITEKLIPWDYKVETWTAVDL